MREPTMKPNPLTTLALLALLLALAAAARFANLDSRPMHADEAVQTYIFSDLLEHGDYRYDPSHFHGPLPHFINLSLLSALGIHSLDTLQAWQFRLQPALAGLLLVLLAGACAGGGASANAATRHRAILLAAVSPTLVYFSRMAIHETLLALCALAVPFAAARWLEGREGREGRKKRWLLAAAVAFGCMHATKETWSVIAFSWAVAAVVLVVMRPRKAGAIGSNATLLPGNARVPRAASGVPPDACLGAWAGRPSQHACRVRHPEAGARSRRTAFAAALTTVTALELVTALALAAAVAMGISFLLYSDFCRHPAGFADAWRTLFAYRTGGGHEKPWWYFLTDILGFYRAGNWFAGEGVICLLALAGGVAAWRRRQRHRQARDTAKAAIPPLPLFLAVSGVAQVIVYSIIKYKTPWLMLVPLASFVPLAAHGWACLRGEPSGRARFSWRAAACALAIAAGLVAPMLTSNFIAPTNTDYRFVYAPTLPEADAELSRIAATLSLSADANANAQVAVIGDDYWPLPWYFRTLRERAGYFSEADAPPPAQLRAFALVIHAGPQLDPTVTGQGWRLLELRPGYYVSVSR